MRARRQGRRIGRKRTAAEANLCSHGKSKGDCPYSHSIIEVMSYQPLYKRFTCTEQEHYENEKLMFSCPHKHFELEEATEKWKIIEQKKQELCQDLSRCTDNTCIKSHSKFEQFWYTDVYINDISNRPLSELFPDDYNKPILFIERSHKEYADQIMAFMKANSINYI